jgi:hypothetical protein
MGQEQGEVEGLALEFVEQRLAELAQAGAGVEDYEVATAADFDAGGVAAIAYGVRAGRRNRTANAPEFDVGARLDGTNLAQAPGKIKLKISNRQKSAAQPLAAAKILAFGRY